MRSRVMSLADAAGLVADGSTIGVGGFGVSGRPMALLYQLVRQGARNLTLLGISNGNDADLLAGAGCLQRIETAAVSLEGFGLAPNFCRAVESGELTVGAYTESTMMDRFLAASLGLSFFPTRVLFGSDVPRVNPDIRDIMCPYTGETYHTVPPARPQWALMHAPAADVHGNILYPQAEPRVEMDRFLIRAADYLIVTVEQLVSRDVVQASSRQVLAPAYKTAAVVEAPFGSHPCGLGGWYKQDTAHFQHYVRAARSPETFDEYLHDYVVGVDSHPAYLQRVGGLQPVMALRLDGMVRR
jgi:glutaconate CoA-transferase subunit A